MLTGIFLLAGGVKGLIGIGLPTVALALLVHFVPLREGAALMVLPAVLTNIWQASSGGHGLALLKRFWLMLVMLCLATWVGVGLLVTSDERLMSGIFGVVITLYAIVGLTRPVPRPLGRRSEVWLSPLIGIANGLLNGLTGSFAFPGILYLEALRLSRDAMIQAMGILFLVASTALAVALTGHKVMTASFSYCQPARHCPPWPATMPGNIAGGSCPRRCSARCFSPVCSASASTRRPTS